LALVFPGAGLAFGLAAGFGAAFLRAADAVGFFAAFAALAGLFAARAIANNVPNPCSVNYFLVPNMPSSYSTISPVTADAATVSGDARNSLPGPERPL
jgi:hypothetical protein